ncbi:MAG: PAS domain S-box protein [Acidobacteriaceae bacterium]|nr:PAS domain S-box protein [Acidobacteriaceae bacterium]
MSLAQPRRFEAEASDLAELPPAPDIRTLAEGFSEHIRVLLRANLVVVLFSEAGTVRLHAMAAQSAELATLVRASYRRHGLQFAADLVRRANSARDTISVTIDPATHGLGGAIPPGMLLVGPFLSSQVRGAIVVYPRAEGPFSKQEKAILCSVCGFLAVAIANAESYASIRRRLRDMQQRRDLPTHQDYPVLSGAWDETFDAITDFIVAHDDSDKICRVNRSLADFIGVQPQELLGVAMSALLAVGTAAPEASCPFCREVAKDSSQEHTVPVLERTYLISTSRFRARDAQGLQTIHVLKDVTDRQDAERRYRELLDNIQEGVFFGSPEGRFIEVNDALTRMLGYATRSDLLQTDIRTQIFSSPEQYDEFANAMREYGAVHNREQILRCADGTLIYVLINAFAVRDAQQNLAQYRGLIQDIHGLKTSQSELHRERDFSSKILDNTQNLVLVVDINGQVTYANRRWYEMGYQRQQLLGRPLQELIAVSRRQVIIDAFACTLRGQQIDNLEVQIDRGAGGLAHFAANLSPMRDDEGKVASIVAIMSDITDAATLQAKLMHAEKMAAVGQLVSGVAHEVNNPLTAILGFADLLMENPDIPDSARKDLRVILQEAQRTKQIVQNLLSFARQTPPQRSPVQLNTILRRTIQLRAYDLHSRGVEVVEQLDKDLRQVIGDSHQLQQVFLNILNNAYDAVRDTGRPARIEVKTENREEIIEIVFRDNGKGIEFPERIFDPFFTTKDVGKGTGLGLSICYGIVREHGGEILCHNNKDGQGATFVVRLPVVSHMVPAAAAMGGTVL